MDILAPDQPRVALVSNGVECIVINKRFFLEHTPAKLIALLRRKVGRRNLFLSVFFVNRWRFTSNYDTDDDVLDRSVDPIS